MFNIKYLLFSLAFLPIASMSADKHVHGEAELFIAIDGNQVLLELESPADNIIGFEHTPATQRQQKQLESGLVKLGSYLSIATFPEANCQQISAEVKSPFKDHHEAEANEDGHDSTHKEHNHEEHSHKEHGHEKDHEKETSHTEFHASYALQCSDAEKNIRTIDINAFKHFTGIKNITVNWVTPVGQGSKKATLSNNEVVLQ